MELPLGGPALRHYTQSRPRPHRQKLNYRPSRPQETIIESENEALELMGRVDEGVEEFFTKKVLPAEILKKEDEESITVHEVAPASSVPCPPPTKTLRRKLGDFFTLKKRRGLKAEASQEGRPKKASIADLIRPLREVARAEKEKEKDKDRVKEHDKENEKEKAKEHPSAVTGDPAVEETPVSGAPPLRGEAAPPRRALREGKSQSLILLSGSAAAGTANARNTAKKQFEGQNSFEQKLHLMLQRIGVSKPQPGETQNQEGEMKKADSEGTIIDSKPEPPASFSKPRTMSASSDTRHQIRPSVSAHESAGKPALLPKPVIKPAPPPTASGRNTPENELGQIQEGETSTPTKPGPPAAPSPAAAPALTPTTTTPTIPTISNSTAITVSPSSTVTPSDTDICTDSVNSTAAATTPANVTELDSKASEGSTTATELSTTTILTPITGTSAPTEPPAAISPTSTSSVVITPTLSVTSTAITTTIPSVTTLENVQAPSSESLAATISPHLSTKSSLPEPGGILSADATPADGGDAPVSSPSTSVSDKSPGLSTTTSSVTGASDDPTLVTSTLETLVSSTGVTTSPPSDSADTTAAAVPQDTPITSSSILISSAPPPPSNTTTTTAGSPTTTDGINSISASTITHSASDFSAPATSSSETTPTGTTSTTISLNHADTTSTTSSSTTAAVSATLSADSVPALTSNLDTTLTTPTLPGLPVPDSSSVPSGSDLTSPIRSDHSPDQQNDLETSPAEQSSAEPLEKDKADEELERVQPRKQTEMNESLGAVDDGKRNEKAILVSGEETKKEEVEEESEKAEEDATPEPLSRKEGGLSDEGGVKGHKEDGGKSVSEK